MKKSTVFTIIAAIVLIDQALKFYIKLNYTYGQEEKIVGDWFRFHFVENEGMAWGWKFGGNTGKLILTVFRLIAVGWGTFLIGDFIKKGYHKGFIICTALIYAGALGNLIDSMFYGVWFDSTYNTETHQNYGVVAKLLTGKGYGSIFQGKVVDMLYFPMIHSEFPKWFPFVGGEKFEFFSPVFNIADASISCGVIAVLLFQKKFFSSTNTNKKADPETVNIVNTPEASETNTSSAVAIENEN